MNEPVAALQGSKAHLGRSLLTLDPRMLLSMSQSACCTELLRVGATCFKGSALIRKSLAATTCKQVRS